MQQVVDLDVGVAVVAVFHFAALAEEGVGFVEEEDCPAVFGGVKNAAQILFGFADVLADDARQIDAIEVEVQFRGEYFGGHRFAGSADAGKQGADAEASRTCAGESPGAIDFGAMTDVGADGTKKALLFGRQHEILPMGFVVDPLGEIVEAGAGLRAAGVPERGMESFALGNGFEGLVDGRSNGGGVQIELRGEIRGVAVRAGWTEVSLPEEALLFGGGLRNVERLDGSFERAHGFADTDERREMELFEKACELGGGAGIAPFDGFGFDVEGGAGEGGFAFPDAH